MTSPASKGAVDTFTIGLAQAVPPAILWPLSAEAGFTTGSFVDVTAGR